MPLDTGCNILSIHLYNKFIRGVTKYISGLVVMLDKSAFTCIKAIKIKGSVEVSLDTCI